MALPFNLDIYSYVFEGILKVDTTGDPVADSVYKLLLPMVVLYMYTDFVISKSRFMGSGGKLKYIMMFIAGFVIIYEGYYSVFATWSIYLLGIIMIWHAGSFILGWGHKTDDTAKSVESVGFMHGSGNKEGGLVGGVSSLLHAPENIGRQLSEGQRVIGELGINPAKKAINRLKELETEFNACEKDRGKTTDIRGLNDIEARVLNEAKGIIADYKLTVKEIQDNAERMGKRLGYIR